MDLKDFIRETLKQIVDGMIEADAEIIKSGGAVNPLGVSTNNSGVGPYGILIEEKINSSRRPVECIEFDVVISAVSNSEAKGGIGIHVGAIGFGSVDKEGKSSTSESRIRFRVPILLPNSGIKKH